MAATAPSSACASGNDGSMLSAFRAASRTRGIASCAGIIPGSAFGINELRGDANAAPRSPHAAFENAAHTECPGDRANILILSPESKRRRAGDDLEAANMRQHVDDLLGQAVAEVLVLLVRAQVGEWEDRNRRFEAGRPLDGVFQGRLHVGHRLKPRSWLLGETPGHDV